MAVINEKIQAVMPGAPLMTAPQAECWLFHSSPLEVLSSATLKTEFYHVRRACTRPPRVPVCGRSACSRDLASRPARAALLIRAALPPGVQEELRNYQSINVDVLDMLTLNDRFDKLVGE